MASSTIKCLNCGQPAGPRFCGFCGQAIDDHRWPLVGLIRDAVEESLSLDGRTVRTLRALAHPGRLTQLYIEGKRVPFLAPLRLYLLASVILFSSAFTLEPPNVNEVNFSVGGVPIGETVRGRPSVSFVDPTSRESRWLATRYAANLARLREKNPQDAINFLFRGLRSTLPIALIAFLPLFALALKLLYVRRHVLYVDHLVFAAHFQSALFFAFASAWLICKVLQIDLIWIILLQFLVFLAMTTIYLGNALGRLHEQSRLMTAGKTFALLVAYMLALQMVFGPAMVFLVSQV